MTNLGPIFTCENCGAHFMTHTQALHHYEDTAWALDREGNKVPSPQHQVNQVGNPADVTRYVWKLGLRIWGQETLVGHD